MAADGAELFVGNIDVHHEPTPISLFKGHFASLVADVSGADQFKAHVALVEAGFSRPDGLTYAMPEAQLEIGDTSVSITPIYNPYGGDRAASPENVLELIDSQLEEGRAVALLSKADGASADESYPYHWTLLTGYYQNARNGEEKPLEKGSYHVIDPAHEQAGHSGRHAVLQQIRRSMESMGVYACVIVPEPEA